MTGASEPEGWGAILTDQLTYFHKGADHAHHTTTYPPPPEFLDLPTALCDHVATTPPTSAENGTSPPAL